MSGPSDAEVIERVLKGDTEAFGLLVDRYQNEFAAYAKHMTGSLDDAADIIQESFIRAYRSLRRCSDRDRFKGWLFRIVSNQCKTHLARRKRRAGRSFESMIDEPATDAPDADAEAAELRGQVQDALNELSPDHREALLLKYVHGLSLPEMAELLSSTVPALKMRLLRGREALREKLRGVAQ